MPQLKVRGIEPQKICKISKALVDELTEIVGCPRDYFTIECINTTSILDGEIVDTFPFIEVSWFDRGQEVQDNVAQVITKFIHELDIDEIEIAFTLFKENKYYSNGVHF